MRDGLGAAQPGFAPNVGGVVGALSALGVGAAAAGAVVYSTTPLLITVGFVVILFALGQRPRFRRASRAAGLGLLAVGLLAGMIRVQLHGSGSAKAIDWIVAPLLTVALAACALRAWRQPQPGSRVR
jgi:hypothetical protein